MEHAIKNNKCSKDKVLQIHSGMPLKHTTCKGKASYILQTLALDESDNFLALAALSKHALERISAPELI